MTDSRFPSPEQREMALKAGLGIFAQRDRRSVKQELEIESAAKDAKTEKLRALRLEKERADRERRAECDQSG